VQWNVSVVIADRMYSIVKKTSVRSYKSRGARSRAEFLVQVNPLQFLHSPESAGNFDLLAFSLILGRHDRFKKSM
jgi:hypothetical protein